ncbi:MAG: response regulator, partial [Proteobacteria bacterium]|nr:response regulator [Pseudomonadota bacterium]
MKDINILFVDDEEFTLKALERILRKESYARYYAESGAEAMRIMADTPIHILVTDIRMPEMDGMSLLRQVKEHYPDTVRLALSA